MLVKQSRQKTTFWRDRFYLGELRGITWAWSWIFLILQTLLWSHSFAMLTKMYCSPWICFFKSLAPLLLLPMMQKCVIYLSRLFYVHQLWLQTGHKTFSILVSCFVCLNAVPSFDIIVLISPWFLLTCPKRITLKIWNLLSVRNEKCYKEVIFVSSQMSPDY